MQDNQIQKSVATRFTGDKLKDVLRLLSSPCNIVITTHYRPDGDAMGSSLGLYNFLKKKNHDVTVIAPGDYPEFLAWLPGNENAINFEKDPARSEKLLAQAGLIFCLDFNWISRVEKMADSLRSSHAKKVLIDHHLDPENAYEFVFSYPEASSTCELVYDFIIALGDEKSIDKNIAECLYCGIMTDTNSFRYSSMKAETHLIIASLMKAGAENFKIHERVYDNSQESRLRLMGYSLYKKLVVLKEFNTAYIDLSENELKEFKFKSGDSEGLVNYALSVEGVRMAALFTEMDGAVKISFRSKGDFSVKDLSSKYFGGGGHKNASGGYSKGSLEETVAKFIGILPLYKAQLSE